MPGLPQQADVASGERAAAINANLLRFRCPHVVAPLRLRGRAIVRAGGFPWWCSASLPAVRNNSPPPIFRYQALDGTPAISAFCLPLPSRHQRVSMAALQTMFAQPDVCSLPITP